MAPQIIGSPDYVRRFGVSGVTLFTQTLNNDTNHVSSVLDTNGFPSLVVTVHNLAVSDFVQSGIEWFADAAGTIALETSVWVPMPGGSVALHIPVLSRYFEYIQFNLAGADGTTSTVNIYGTSLPFVNVCNQNKFQPLCSVNATIASSAIQTQQLLRMFPGEAMITIDDNVNNKWTCWMEYWDATLKAWTQFWSAHGTDKGQGWTERVILPAAPVRVKVRNDDTVSHGFLVYVIGS